MVEKSAGSSSRSAWLPSALFPSSSRSADPFHLHPPVSRISPCGPLDILITRMRRVPMGKIFIADLREGEPVTSFFLAKDIQVRQRRGGESYLTLVLADRTGEVSAVMGGGVGESGRGLGEGDIG